MQQLAGANQRRGTAATVDAILEREMRVADRLHELVGDDRQRADGALRGILADHLLM